MGKAKTITFAAVKEAVEKLNREIVDWQNADGPLVDYRGAPTRAISEALSQSCVTLFEFVDSDDIEPEAWPIVLAIDNFEREVTHHAEQTSVSPNNTDPGGGTPVWFAWNLVIRSLVPAKKRIPPPMTSLVAEGVRYRQIAKIFGWYEADGITPDERKVVEEINSPGKHFNPDTYVHPSDAKKEVDLQYQWEERRKARAAREGRTVLGPAKQSTAKEWAPPPETIEQLLKQEVSIRQIAKMHRVEENEVRAIAADIGVFSDPLVVAIARDNEKENARKRRKIQVAKVNTHPELPTIEERVFEMTLDGHTPGMVAEAMQLAGFPQVTRAYVLDIIESESVGEDTATADAEG